MSLCVKYGVTSRSLENHPFTLAMHLPCIRRVGQLPPRMHKHWSCCLGLGQALVLFDGNVSPGWRHGVTVTSSSHARVALQGMEHLALLMRYADLAGDGDLDGVAEGILGVIL